MRNLVLGLSAIALAAMGCDGGDTPDPMTDAGGNPGTDAGMMMGTDAGSNPGTDAGPGGDGNDSFATAQDASSGEVMGRISPAGDVDFYSFTGTAGQWLIVATEANPEDMDGMVDTVVTLFDSGMNQIAENDDAVPRVSTDSEIITRLPADGTYYVQVQEYSQWAGDTPEGDPSFTYTLTLATLNPDAAAATVEMTDPGDTAADAPALGLALNMAGTADFGFLAGAIDSATDVDVYALSGEDARRLVQAVLLPGTTDGNGSTLVPEGIWITNADGTEIIAEMDPATQAGAFQGEVEISPSLGAGDYRLWIDHGASAGANDFYVFKLFRFGENPLEDTANDADNDVAAGADALSLMDREGTDVGFILATLGVSDTDHFSFTAEAGDVASVFCASASAGSGVEGLTVTLLNADGTDLSTPVSGTETPTMAAQIDEAALPGAGTYLIRLTKSGQSATVTGDWVRCGVAVGAAG